MRRGQVLGAAGKILVVHGDGEMRVLLERLMACGVQVVEALTPQPMTAKIHTAPGGATALPCGAGWLLSC